MKDKLFLHLNDDEAKKRFKQEIRASLSDKWRKFDNFIHNLKRK